MKPRCNVSVDLLVKVVMNVLSPSFEESTATAATEMLYLVPGIKSLMVKKVSVVPLLKLTPPTAHWIVYEVALPSGSFQLKFKDDVVKSTMARLLTAAGSANSTHKMGCGSRDNWETLTHAYRKWPTCDWGECVRLSPQTISNQCNDRDGVGSTRDQAWQHSEGICVCLIRHHAAVTPLHQVHGYLTRRWSPVQRDGGGVCVHGMLPNFTGSYRTGGERRAACS